MNTESGADMPAIFDVIVVILLVDFASGLLHWLEDSYGRPHWPLIGQLITIPNILHHHRPAYFTRQTWLKSAQVLLGIGAAILAASWLMGCLTWQVGLFVAIGVNANELHKWNHLPRRKRPAPVVLLQRLRILQTPAHHARHHAGSKDTHYCVITNLVNPVLKSLGFWRRLERAVALLTGARKRTDWSVAVHHASA